MVRQEEEISSEEGIDGHEFSELSESRAASGPWKSNEPPTIEDVNSDFFSLMCNVVDCDADALGAIDTQGESDFCVPSGPVNEAEITPVSAAGVDRSRY